MQNLSLVKRLRHGTEINMISSIFHLILKIIKKRIHFLLVSDLVVIVPSLFPMILFILYASFIKIRQMPYLRSTAFCT